MLTRIEDYPLLDEDHHSELEWNEASEAWERMGLAERMELCAENGVSIFAARRPYIPSDDNGNIFDALRG